MMCQHGRVLLVSQLYFGMSVLNYGDNISQDGAEHSITDNSPAASVNGIEGIDSSCKSGNVRGLGPVSGNAFFTEEGTDTGHGQYIGNQIDDHGQVNQYIELFEQGRAHGGKGQNGLDQKKQQDGHIRCTETVYLFQERRKMTDNGGGTDYF